MSKKNRKGGIVFSTNPDFEPEYYDEDEIETLPPNEQNLKVLLDRKQRKGKVVTLIEGFIGTTDDLKDLEKKLKNLCGTGGSSKNNEIIIQGDHREKIMAYLQSNEYKVKRVGG